MNKMTCDTGKIKALPESFLTNDCLKVPTSGIDMVYFAETITFIPTSMPIGTWCNNGDIVLFIDSKGDSYITCASHALFTFLEEHGFHKETSLKMPTALAKGGFPADKAIRIRWDSVCRRALINNSLVSYRLD